MSNIFRTFIFLTVLSVFKFALAAHSRSPYLRHYTPQNVISVEEMDALESNNVKRGAELHLFNDSETLPSCSNNVKKQYIPEQFDSRVKWPYCPSLWEISDQGNCASCWAVAVTSTLTDRYCIANKGLDHFPFSSQDLLSCGAEDAAWDADEGLKGCAGGNVHKALKYVLENGIVSGGPYRPSSRCGCQPYQISPCFHKAYHLGGINKCDGSSVETPECVRKCQSSYSGRYADNLKQLSHACTVDSSVEKIQTEIMKNGPVIAVMKLWKSFFHYNTSEIFRVEGPNNRVIMNHAVKIIGWGTEVQHDEETPYWLVSNSFNYDWGQNGFFKIVRGKGSEGACIEQQVSVGIFNVPETSQNN